jgi:hypothetical protein
MRKTLARWLRATAQHLDPKPSTVNVFQYFGQPTSTASLRDIRFTLGGDTR